jgi:hypothetical protein
MGNRFRLLQMEDLELLCTDDPALRCRFEAVRQLQQSSQVRGGADADAASDSAVVKNASRDLSGSLWTALRHLHEAITADEPTARSVIDAGAALVDRLASVRQEMVSVEAASTCPNRVCLYLCFDDLRDPLLVTR